MSGTTTNLTKVYAKELQDAQEKYVECHHVFTAAKEWVSLLKSQDAPLTCGQKQHLEKVEASLPDLEAALFEAEEELESANISYSFRRFAPSTATASIPVASIPVAVPLAATATASRPVASIPVAVPVAATATATASIFTTKRSDFGMYKFADPCRQATYEHHETRYTKMLKVKNAYDKQELLRKIRDDMKREFLTRKKQVKRLQMDAAIDFRNAESSLQEHYATEAADHYPYIRAVDITAPLVSRIQLPRGEILDLKTFDANHEFAKVRQIHEDLRRDQEKQEQEQEQHQWWEANADALAKWEQRNYEQRRPYAPRGEEQQQQQQEEEQSGRYGDGGYCGCDDLECSDCYSYGNQNDDQSSYDSEYDDPREYNYERECREAEEAEAEAEAEAARQAAIQQQWMEKTHNDAYQQACDAFAGGDDETWDEEARANEAEHRCEVAQMRLNDDLNYTCDDYPDVQQLEVVAITEPRERVTASAASGGGISAKKKASAGAAKARIAKQQRNKKQQQQIKQFVPIQITVNTNRVTSDETESASSTLLYQGKAEINLPKKNLQNVSREGKKRDAEKWRRINAAEKQSNARGTRITNIPEPRAWHNCGGSDNEYNEWDVDH